MASELGLARVPQKMTRRKSGKPACGTAPGHDGFHRQLKASYSVRQNCEGPDRAALRHRVLELVARDVPIETADAGQYCDVLPTVVGIGDRLRVDARAG